ncbi:MAG: hypothetical protein V4609_16315 [Pseudomonadota bacterium]
MTHSETPNDSKQRLERTRQAIVAHIQEKKDRRTTVRDRLRKAFSMDRSGRDATPGAADPSRQWRVRLARMTETARDYWQEHPAHFALEMATPGLKRFAQRRPVTFLALSAAAGALIFVARPWRMISITGLAVAALRSRRLSGALMSAVYGQPRGRPPH